MSAAQRLNEYLTIVDESGVRVVRCRCGQDLGPASENYKHHARVEEGDVRLAGPQVNPAGVGPGRYVVRLFYCPGCVTLLETEVALRGEPYLWDVELFPPAPGAPRRTP